MVAAKLVNFFAISSLAVLICALGATPASAVSLADHHKLVRAAGHGHSEIAKKKKRSSGSSSRCKAKTSSSLSSAAPPSTLVPSSTSSWTEKTTAKPATSTHYAAPAPTTSAAKQSGGGSSGSSSPGSQKLGVGWGGVGDVSLVKSSHTKYIYNWGPTPIDGATDLGFTYMSMLWGNAQDKIDSFLQYVNSPEVGCLMGPNEINQSGQSNLSGEEAAQLWKQYIQPHAGGKCTVSPSVSSATDGISILQDFFNACGSCSIDYTSVHWYGTVFSQLQTYLEQMHSTFGRPVMLTEVADNSFTGGPQPNLSEVRAFYSQLISYANSVDWLIVFPFLFGVSENGVDENNALMTGGATLTQLGSDLLSFNI